MYNEVELWLFPDTDISELQAVPGPKAPGLGEFECIAFALGIDCPDVRQVVSFGLPRDIESYIQETDRSGH